MEKYGFVYIWRDRKHKRYYIGCHWGKEDDGYICSSRWMRKAYRRRPGDFKRRILSRIYTNRKDMFIMEDKWLSLIKENELKKKYYNFKKLPHDHIENDGSYTKKYKETLFKPGQIPYNKGIPNSEETRKAISEANQGRIISEEARNKQSETMKEKFRNGYKNWDRTGFHPSEETIEKIRQSNLGKKMSPEAIKNISEGHKGQIPWNKDKPHSEEHKAKLKLAWEKRKQNENYSENKMKMTEAIRKIAEERKGIPLTEEHKLKMKLGFERRRLKKIRDVPR